MSNTAKVKKAVKTANGIALSEVSGSSLQWFYGDMKGKEYDVTETVVGETKGSATKQPKKCFEIHLDGREEPVRIMPIQALNAGIAEIIGEEIIVNAQVITAIENDNGAIALSKVS
jgi:hypothetical protein